MERLFIFLGALGGFLGVALGAFGAHVLRDRLAPGMAQVWETGVHYQLIHALALVVVGLAFSRLSQALLKPAGWAFAIGILFFSGSLYALALTARPIFGPITPIGGVSFLVGWALLAIAALRA